MKIYVINLASSRKRRKTMKRRLELFKLQYEVISAVTADEIDSVMLQNINSSCPRGVKLKSGEVACSKSHAKALKKMLHDGEDIGVILEDDVVFHRRFSDLVNSISLGDLKAGPLLLSAQFFSRKQITKADSLTKDSYHYTVDSSRNVWGTLAYAIKKDDAKRLASQMSNTCVRADDWNYYIDNGIIPNITLCFPFPVKHEELNSDIANFSKSYSVFSISGISKIIHKYRIFPLFQISIFIRQRRAEKRQMENINAKNLGFSRTYRLK